MFDLAPGGRFLKSVLKGNIRQQFPLLEVFVNSTYLILLDFPPYILA